MKTITLNPEINELHKLNEFVLKELPNEDIHVNLITEEIFINIVNYSKTEFIKVNVDYADQILTLEFIDNGTEFNPLLKKDYVLPDNIAETQIGGLGIFFTKEFSDELEYHYINGENRLKITKVIS